MSLSEKSLAYCAFSRDELHDLFRDALPTVLETIEGYRYRGVSLGLPSWVERLSWKKFAKSFVRSQSGQVHGWNVRIHQDDLDLPWRPQLRDGIEWRFGSFGLRFMPGSDHVEIDYGMGTGGLSPMRRLRDPIRSLDANGDVLLGHSLIDVGLGRRIATPSWFLLERDVAL